MDDTLIASESHVPSFGRELFLMIHDMDDIRDTSWGELLTRGVHNTENISSKFDRHNLGTKTYPKIWDIPLSCILCCHDHAFCTTSPESSWNTDSIEYFEDLHATFFDIFCLDKCEFDILFSGISCALESLVQRIIGIFESDIFPDHSNTQYLCRCFDIFEEFLPFRHIRSLWDKSEGCHHLLSKIITIKQKRDTIDRVECRCWDDMRRVNPCRMSNLRECIFWNLCISSDDEKIWRKPVAHESTHRVLDRLSLKLLTRTKVWEERYMDEYHILIAKLMLKLPSGFEDILVLHITDCTTDLYDRNIGSCRLESCLYLLFHKISEMWDDLDRTS